MNQTTKDIQIQQAFNLLSFDFLPLLEDSIEDGHRHIQRLINDYTTGENKFNKPGESLFVALLDNAIIGVCGLNQYPYNNLTYGRLRRLYVKKTHRKLGIGRMLVETVLKHANENFEILVLKTDSFIAGRFFESLGFKKITYISDATHIKEFDVH